MLQGYFDRGMEEPAVFEFFVPEVAISFEHFAHSFPENVILLIDTYDTEAAAEKVVQLATASKSVSTQNFGVIAPEKSHVV